MCVKLINENNSTEFNISKPLEDQLKGCKQIVIDFKPNDVQVEKFLDEIERITKNGVACNLNIRVLHNNQIQGAKLKKQAKECVQGLSLNEVIKMMALTYDKTDRALEEIFKMCNLSKTDVK